MVEGRNLIPFDAIVMPIPAANPFDLIVEQSHRINTAALPEIHAREHMARPYPARNFDLLMINVPASYQQGTIPDGEEPPHGMLRVIAMARKSGYNVGILDAHRLKLTPDVIVEQITKTGAKAVGLNPTSVNIPEALVIADACDKMSIPVVLGGIHATLDPVIAREDFPKAFAIVRGDGEIAILEVLEALRGGPKTKDKGIYYHGDPHSGREDRAPESDPRDLPVIEQAELVEEPVYVHQVMINGLSRVIREATTFATKGCPFDCTFCSSSVMVARNRKGTKPYDRPEMPHILDEIEYMVEVLGADAVHFLDDMAFVTPKHIWSLHRGLQERGLSNKIIWRGLTRAPVIEKFDHDTMIMMKESGVWKVALGVESGNDDVLDKIKKKVTKNQVREAVKKLTRYGIASKGFFIMGFPGETREQILDTFEFMLELKRLGMTEASVFQYKPYPGTEDFTILVQSKPEILSQLHYLQRRMHTSAETGLSGMAHKRASSTVWLPDDLYIAQIPSKEVREFVVSALEAFYGNGGVVFDRRIGECI